MIISEKQIWELLNIAQEFALTLYEKDKAHALYIAKLTRDIKEQQSNELKEFK